VALLTTCNEEYQRVSMHGVRIELARRQADETGLPLHVVWLSKTPSNDEYQTKMSEYLLARKSEGASGVAFGDIFLADLKQWRESNLASIDMSAVFPLWGEDTTSLVREFLSLGFGSVVCCVNDAYLGEDAVGRVIDETFLAGLPANVDPCGENGEFHSFAFRGPIFERNIEYAVGGKVYRPLEAAGCDLPGNPVTKGFWFCDLLQA
jgi:uncharacterized protein (TIGR00290 family)